MFCRDEESLAGRGRSLPDPAYAQGSRRSVRASQNSSIVCRFTSSCASVQRRRFGLKAFLFRMARLGVQQTRLHPLLYYALYQDIAHSAAVAGRDSRS